MVAELIITALDIPAGARIDKRVEKKLLLEQGMPTAADKRQVQSGIEEIRWIAALKPANIGIQVYKDEGREYLEIAVLSMALRPEAKELRLVELMHRLIPYPLVLIASQGENASLSLAHKRWSQGEAGKVVIDDIHRTALFRPDIPTTEEACFLGSISLSGIKCQNLCALYKTWIDRITALEAARITGSFILPESASSSDNLHSDLVKHESVKRELMSLRAKAAREKQINRLVEINLNIKQLENCLSTLFKTGNGGDGA